MYSTKEVALISLASGSLTLASYLLLQKAFSRSRKRAANQEASKIYEDQALLDMYMVFNFADSKDLLLFDDLKQFENVQNCALFPKRVALLCRDFCPDIFFEDSGQAQAEARTALDIGCAVGRSCFELSKLFQSVVGIDYSDRFIQTCKQLQASGGHLEYEGKLEGDLRQKLRVKLEADVRLDRIRFEVGDACHLREGLGEFDLVLASNLICRLLEPKKFFARLKQLVKSRKYVILSTPFSWGESFTPKVRILFC